MENFANRIVLNYGDAQISFYNIKVSDGKEDPQMIWHRHRYFEIHFALDGNNVYRFSDKEVLLQQGEILIIPPDMNHYPVLSDNRNILVIPLSVERVEGEQHFFEAMQEALIMNSLTPIKFKFEDAAFLSRGELYNSVLGVLKLKQIATDFTYRLFSMLIGYNPSITSGNAVMVLIDTLVNSVNVTLDDIANATNYSKRHLTRLIKQNYGMTLTEIKCKNKELNNE